MKKIRLVVCLLFPVLLLFAAPVMGSSDWVEYDKDDDGTVRFYDKGKYIVRVWEKEILSNQRKENDIQMRREFKQSIKGWDKLSYDMTLYEIDCNNRKINILSDVQYDSDGKVLSSVSYDKPRFSDIPPDSSYEFLRKKFCK